MKYRINYDNGQVSQTFTSYRAAKAELLRDAADPWAATYRIQRYAGEGEWVSIGQAGRLETGNSEGIRP
jgi:hypothetical protein